MKKPIALIILDGWGYSTDTKNNAVAAANTPYFDYLWENFSKTLLEASGPAVGLPLNQVGNSEIGHTTIGAGKAIDTDLVAIAKAIESGDFHNNTAFVAAFSHAKEYNSRLHLMGLLSDGGVHSHKEHLFELLRAAKLFGLNDIAIHIFTDGRDTSTTGSVEYVRELEDLLLDLDIGFIASISGRYFAMDRDNNFDRLEKTTKALFSCEGGICEIKASRFLKDQHESGIFDEHIEPILIKTLDRDPVKIEKNDSIIFFNFRSDRARMLSQHILEKKESQNLYFVTMTQYKSDFDAHIAFPAGIIETTLAKEISRSGFSQVHIAETEKFPHATYFLNGGVEIPYENETHILLDSRKDVPTHDLAPEMRALDIAQKAVESIEKGSDFLFVNIANPDMVGHTAKVSALVTALEVSDAAMKIIVQAVVSCGGVAIVTADHGNAEVNAQEDGSPHTSHTYNLVPCIIVDSELSQQHITKEVGTLCDLAPTILQYLQIEKPLSMTGNSLVKK
jgi:2,3-bisphosphoglycerate-independent phosphoglycerate mutase